MALPGHRRTSSHKRRRSAHFALKTQQLATCPKCHKPTRPHHVCLFCGSYKNQEVIKIKALKRIAKKKSA